MKSRILEKETATIISKPGKMYVILAQWGFHLNEMIKMDSERHTANVFGDKQYTCSPQNRISISPAPKHGLWHHFIRGLPPDLTEHTIELDLTIRGIGP